MINSNSTTPLPSSIVYSPYCMYRLPCGYCTYMNRPCTMQGNDYTPTPSWGLSDVQCRVANEGDRK